MDNIKIIQKPNTGALFHNKAKTHPNAPDVTGDVHLSRDLLKQLMQKDGDLVKISLSAWKTEAKTTGLKYLSVIASEPYDTKPKPEEDEDLPF